MGHDITSSSPIEIQSQHVQIPRPYRLPRILALSTQNQDMCHGTIGSNQIEIPMPYRLSMGPCLGIGASTIYVHLLSTRIFTLLMNKILMSSKNCEAHVYKCNLNLQHKILYLVSLIIWNYTMLYLFITYLMFYNISQIGCLHIMEH